MQLDATHILESITDAFFTLDREWQFTYLNAQAERLLSRTREDLVGKNVWAEFPAAIGASFDREYHRAVNEHVTVTFEEYYPEPLDTWFEVRAFPSEEGLSIYFQDITQRKKSEASVLAAQQQVTDILESITDAFYALDQDFCFTYINHKAEEQWKRPRLEMLGQPLLSVLPNAEKTYSWEQHQIAMRERRPIHFETLSVIIDKWLDVNLYPSSDGGLSVYYRDISDRKQAEQELRARAEREALLNNIQQAIRAIVDPAVVQQTAAQTLAEALHVDRCYFSFMDLTEDMTWVGPDFHRDDLPSVAGKYRISDFEVDPMDYYPNGQTLIIDDIETFSFPEPLVTALKNLRLRSAVTVPLFDQGNLVATLTVAMADEPRIWTTEEATLIEAVASQTRASVEAARLLEEQQARLQREALINRIALAIRSSQDPEKIQENAVALLGEALGADRCYLARYDFDQCIVTIANDWHRNDLPTICGSHKFSNTLEMFGELYKDTSTSVIRDAYTYGLSDQTIANMESLQLRSRVSVALSDTEGIIATLTASMADEPRDWTSQEVELIEAVATQMRTAVEMARLQQREHRIATELQAALQPDLPERVPNLAIAGYMKPALDEAAVGGDFFDIFALDKEIYAIVIGDVSGKGLAAAAQLATVRNMLRGVLYQYRSPSEAVTSLNTILTTHNLLIGFVTAFIGLYNVGTGQLSFASCGHEPGLLHRAATTTTELLETTGPPLGVAENFAYAENSVVLEPGDSLLLYTDGISEAGTSRQELLGIDGLIQIFENISESEQVEVVAQQIVAEANAFASGVFRDDVCVLLTRRTPSPVKP